jgi:hypothetical protein
MTGRGALQTELSRQLVRLVDVLVGPHTSTLLRASRSAQIVGGPHLLPARGQCDDLFAVNLQAVERVAHWSHAGWAAYRRIADFQPERAQKQLVCAVGWENREAVGCEKVRLAGASRLPNERKICTLVVMHDDGLRSKGGVPNDVHGHPLTVAIKQSDAWITVQTARRRSHVPKP